MKICSKKFFLLFILLSILTACSGDDDAGTGNTDNDPPNELSLVNKISLEAGKVETPIAPKNPGNYSVWFTMVSNNIYYANPSNTAVPQFMLKYNVSGNYFQTVTPDDEVCACGYMSKIVGDENRLFYIANEAVRYNVGAMNWTDLNYPLEFSQNNGETGVVYQNNKVYFLGGRDSSTRFKYYDTVMDNWGDLATYPYPVDTPDMVVVNNKIYALGGDIDKKKFGVYEEGAGWTELTDLNFQAVNGYMQHTVTSFQNRFIFIMNELSSSSVKIHVYDTQENEWKEHPIELALQGNNNYHSMNIFSNNSYLYLVTTDYDNEMSLHKINVSFE